MNVRPSALAGRWYSGDPAELRSDIRDYLDAARAQKLEGIRAIVVPHAGHFWSGPTAAAAYNAIDTAAIRRIFIFCPNHRMPVRGAAGVSFDAFETPLGRVPVDRSTLDAWERDGVIALNDAAHRPEHAIEIQLPFIQVLFGDRVPPIVPIIVGLISTADVKKLAQRLKADLRDDDLVLISSDFVHYGADYDFVPFGAPVQPQIKEYDHRTMAAIRALDGASFDRFAEQNPHAACGIHSLRLLSHAFEGAGLEAYELAYDTSGRRSGDDHSSVSYLAIAVAAPHQGDKIMTDPLHPVSDAAQKTAREIVKRALAEAVAARKSTPVPADLDLGDDPAVFHDAYGVFVTLNSADGNLRGCIGNIVPVARLAESLWGRAQDAAIHDPRFNPVTASELPSLSFEISVLTPPEPIAGPDDIVIGKHGVILKKSGRSAVFLPQVAPEQGWDVPQTLTALSRKAGLAPQAWREGASFAVFEAQVF